MAALLAAPLLFAAAPAEAHTRADGESHMHFTLVPSATRVVEGGSITVRVRCDTVCGNSLGLFAQDTHRYSTAYVELGLTPDPGTHGASLPAAAADRRVMFTPRQNGYPDGYTPSGMVTVSVADDGMAGSSRQVTITGTAPYTPNWAGYTSGNRNSFWYVNSGDAEPFVTSATLTILDADAEQLTLNITDTNGDPVTSLTEGDTASVSVSRASAGSSAVTVMLAPATSSDYTLTTATLTIPANMTDSPTTTFTATSNTMAGPDKQVTLTATTSTTGYRDSAPATLTILDAQTETLSLNIANTAATTDDSIDESDQDAGTPDTSTTRVSVSRPTTGTAAVTVTLSAAAVSPATSADFTTSWSGATTTLTIPANMTSSPTATAPTIMAVDNDTDGPETKLVTLTAATTASGYRGAMRTLTINDDDTSALTVDESGDGTTVAENQGTDTFTVRLASEPRGSSVTVAVSVHSGDTDECRVSVDGTTYVSAGSSGTLTFLPSAGTVNAANQRTRWSTAQTVTVQGVNDDVDADHTCRVLLDPSSPGSMGDSIYDGLSTTTVTVTVTDDDTASLVRSPASLTVTEAAAGREGTFDVNLGSLPSASVTVTATAGSAQCQVRSGAGAFGSSTALTFATTAWSTAQTVTVRAVDDAIDDDSQDDCDITLDPSSAPNGDAVYHALTDVTVDVTVTDDDDAGLTVSKTSVSTSEPSGTDSFTVRLATQPTAAVTVTVSSSATDEAAVSPASLVFGAAADPGASPPVLLWSAAQTVTVTGENDDLQDGQQMYTITVAAASAQSGGDALYNSDTDVPDQTVSGTNADDDTAGLMAVPATTPLRTSEDGSETSFTVRLMTQPTADVEVAVSVENSMECEVKTGSGSYGSSLTLTFTPATAATLWSTAQTVMVRGVDDTPPALDGTQSCDITLDPSSTNDGDYNGLDNVVLQGENRDNEAPTVTLTVSPGSISEDGGVATVTASLDRAVTVDTTVVVDVEAEDPATANDYRLSANKTLTIAANSMTSTGAVTITAVDNNVDAPDKTVTVTGTTSGGQGAADPDEVTLTITDDEAAPTVSLSVAEPAIWEDGGATAVSARLSHPSSADTTVTVTTTSSGIRLADNPVITIPAGATTSPETVAVTAVDNNQASNADLVASISGTVQNSQGEGEVRDASLTVWDNETASVSLALEPERVAEGAAARVSAALTRPARTALTLTVSAAPGEGATEASFRLGAERTLSVAAGARASAGSVELLAVDDEVDAPDRTVTVSASVEGRARTPDPVALTIEDDDETPQAMLILTPAMIDESGAENMAAVTAALERPSSEATTIMVSAQGMGFTQRGTALTIAAGRTASAGSVTITAVDDEEQTPDREVRVTGVAENAHGVVQPEVAVLTIRDDDGTEAVTEVLLPEAARAMADSRATAVRRRLERAAAGEASDMPSLTAASAMGLLAEHGASLQKDDLDWKTLLPRTSFALPLSAAGGDGAGGGVTVWGGGDYRDLDGEARGVKWDGEVSSLHLGADRLLANGMRLGVAASWSEAKFDYKHRNRGGDWELEMTSVQPYLGWTAANGIELWASAGAGSGDLDLDSGSGGVQSSDADMWLAAAGARGPLYMTESGLQVSLRGEALYSSFEVDDNRGRIRGYTADASRLRLALEARRERMLESGALLSPRFELGVRHDGGDGETGAGVELGGGAEYAAGRLTVSGGARALVANSDYDEWGADFALAYAAAADGRGLSFRLVPSWGAVQSGTEQLWNNGAPGLNGAAEETDPAARLEAELGYALKSPWSRGVLQLTLGGEAGGDADAACRLKGAVALDASATLGLELEVRDPRTGGAERSLMVTGELRF